jgi:hypothetical protein
MATLIHPLLADAINIPLVLGLGLALLVPLMLFEVGIEALILSKAWRLPYGELCRYAFFANCWSLAAGIPTKILNAFLYCEVLLPQDMPGFLARYPFLFQLTAEEAKSLRSQFATSKQAGNPSQIAMGSQKPRDPRFLPYAFTENGAIMAANVLNSPAAVRMSVFVVRAFIKMRELLGGTKELARQLAGLEKKLTARLDVHESVIVDVLRRVMEILDPPPLPPEPPRRRIGFHVRPEDEAGAKGRKKA